MSTTAGNVFQSTEESFSIKYIHNFLKDYTVREWSFFRYFIQFDILCKQQGNSKSKKNTNVIFVQDEQLTALLVIVHPWVS